MAEAEMRAATMLIEVGSISLAFMGAWVSLTFAYLTAAYFVGQALSRFQCGVISVFYGVMAVVFAMSAVGYAKSWSMLYERDTGLFGDVRELGFPWWGEASAFFFYGGICVSLYFMYNVRQNVVGHAVEYVDPDFVARITKKADAPDAPNLFTTTPFLDIDG